MKRTLPPIVAIMLFVIASFPAFGQRPLDPNARQTVTPTKPAVVHGSINFRDAAIREGANPPRPNTDIDDIDAPQPAPIFPKALPITGKSSRLTPLTVPPSPTGPAPAPARTFKAEFLSGTTIPPDTMGAVGTTHIVTVSNNNMRIQTRDGVQISRLSLTSFWSGVTIKGAAISAFDPKVYFDKFNNRFILISSGNGQTVNSGAMFAVSATADPTGTWYQWTVVADPTSTAAGGHWIDYPTVGHNKNWIVVDDNVFNFGTATPSNGYWGQELYVIDKVAAYANAANPITEFQGDYNNACLVEPAAAEFVDLSCGFTLAPAITEDNTTDTEYLVEDWDDNAGQLRLSKLTGTGPAPVLTVGTQFTQAVNGWVGNAARITTAGTQSGGYLPQRQQSANLVSGSRIMANDARIQNSVYRAGTLWTTHTVMLAANPTPAPATFGTTNPDIRSGIQWWQLDPTNEAGPASTVSPLQLGVIQDPLANNCHNGAGATQTTAPCLNSLQNEVGEFFAFPNISVNQNGDMFLGFSRFSPFTYPSSAYTMKMAGDPANTTRTPVIFRPGQANYNIGAGSGSTRQNRWGDYSSSMTDPLNDTDFWTIQEYAGTDRNDFLAPSYAGPWETWWAQVKPTGPTPSPAGTLIISELRLRGPQGVRDEYVELYNPGAAPVIVNTTDNSEGWALAFSNNGTTVTSLFAIIPNGTVIPAHGHFLIADNPDNTAGGTSALTYSLNGYACITVRGADTDTGWSLDLADNGGVALFNTATQANFAAGTRLDSAGFSAIAAGLFKEGNGIPAVTATTPTGQMTFMRILSSGTPQDTGANENDFILADPVVGETLGSTPRLGAAGPENLSGPINGGGANFPSALLDAGIPAAYAPNTFRDLTAGPVATSTLGTITFRRVFTNNTGAPLTRLRFRIVDVTTNPPAPGSADLRAITSAGSTVPLSGGGTATTAATTLEQPPAQAAGGGLNGSLSVGSVTLGTPLASGGTVSLDFTAGVQVNGTYNFCLVPEGDTPTGAAPLCFTGSTLNTNPSITPGGPLTRQLGESTSSTIATVSDVEDAAGTLIVTATSVPAGITISGISNSGGTVTATVAASCAATLGTNNVTLQVADSQGGINTATLVVNVTATPTPTITPGGPTTFCAGGSVTLTSSSATGNQWSLNGNPIGGATNNTYIATLAGNYTVVASPFGCPSAASSITTVTVNPLPAAPTITPGGPTTFCTGGSVTLTSSAASGNQWLLNGNPIGGATNTTYVATASGSYTVTTTDGNSCTSPPSSATVVTVNPIPATPTITPGGPTTFCAGGSVTLTSSAASGNQWFLNGNPIGGATNTTYNATASGSYTVTETQLGCSSAPSSATVVTVNPIPATPTITPGGPTSFCPGGSVTLTSSSASGNQWFLNGNPIGGATNQTYVANATGGYTVTVTTSGCTSSPSATTTVTVNPNPDATITAPGSMMSTTSSTASVANAGVGATYAWSITNGTINSGNGTASINFTAGSVGTLMLQVTVTTAAGCSDTKSANVTVTPNIPPVTVTSVSPSSGTYLGNTAVTVHGTGFLTGATVTFGGSSATSVVVVNSTTITARTPAHVAGPVNVVVTNTNTASGTLVNGYTYTHQFDANGDHTVDPSDIFYLIKYIFDSGPPPAGAAGMLSGDANNDGVVDSADIFYLVNYLFLGGPAPASRITPAAMAEPFGGTLSFGAPVVRDGRTYIPVILTLADGAATPQALALKIDFDRAVRDLSMHRVGAAKDATSLFEVNQPSARSISYLVSFNQQTGGLALGAGAQTIAEIELSGPAGLGVRFDPAVTTLTDSAGVRAASVSRGNLKLSNSAAGNDSHPSPKENRNE